jgi:hypothetical protein
MNYGFALGAAAQFDLRDLREFIRVQRGTLDGFDIVVGGSPRRDDWDDERAYIHALAVAG